MSTETPQPPGQALPVAQAGDAGPKTTPFAAPGLTGLAETYIRRATEQVTGWLDAGAEAPVRVALVTTSAEPVVEPAAAPIERRLYWVDTPDGRRVAGLTPDAAVPEGWVVIGPLLAPLPGVTRCVCPVDPDGPGHGDPLPVCPVHGWRSPAWRACPAGHRVSSGARWLCNRVLKHLGAHNDGFGPFTDPDVPGAEAVPVLPRARLVGYVGASGLRVYALPADDDLDTEMTEEQAVARSLGEPLELARPAACAAAVDRLYHDLRAAEDADGSWSGSDVITAVVQMFADLGYDVDEPYDANVEDGYHPEMPRRPVLDLGAVLSDHSAEGVYPEHGD